MGIRNNLYYSTLQTLSTYLVPLFVFPYISRILGADGVGIIDSVDSIMNYAVLLSMMGLTTIGVREIARCNGNHAELTKTFSSLFALNIISTIIVLVLLVCLILFVVPDITDRKDLFCIGMTKVLANLFWIEWFFKGIENFKYITLRSITVRCLFIILVFCLVKDKSDLIVYYILWVGMTIANAICNTTYRCRLVKFVIREVSLSKYVVPFISLGLFAICSAVYTQLNVVYLKTVTTDTQVGLYTTATKLYTVVMALFSSLTAVMIPRMSALVKENKTTEIIELIHKTFNLLFLFAFPVVIFFEFFAPEFIRLFAGVGFEGAILPMRLVIMQLFIIGTEQIFILQIMIPAKKDMQAVSCAACGALVCVLVNLFVTHKLECVGSSIAWIAAELTVLILSSIYIRRYFHITFPYRLFFKNAILSLPYLLIGTVISFSLDNYIYRLVSGILVFAVWGVVVEERFTDIRLLSTIANKFKTK